MTMHTADEHLSNITCGNGVAGLSARPRPEATYYTRYPLPGAPQWWGCSIVAGDIPAMNRQRFICLAQTSYFCHFWAWRSAIWILLFTVTDGNKSIVVRSSYPISSAYYAMRLVKAWRRYSW